MNGDLVKQILVKHDKKVLLLIILINALLKTVPAIILELGNDEVYYLTYALFPDWSHFDHPPMVGFVIQATTLNLLYDSELFIRAGSIILSSASIFILYYLVKKLYSVIPAFFAVLLFISSFYFNIISGLFILPDTPMVFFVLASLYYLLPALTEKDPSRQHCNAIVLFGLFTGFAFLSKYHSLFLWVGAGLYILFHNRIWFRKPSLYLSILLTLALMIPVLVWNINNDFVSFTFHSGRIGLFHSGIDLLSFLRFNIGQFFYQNPVSSIIYLFALFSVFFNIRNEKDNIKILLIYLSIPLIIFFVFISLFRNTLPHWSGPAFVCLIILSSDYLGQVYAEKSFRGVRLLSASVILFSLVIIIATVQIRFGIVPFGDSENEDHPGKNDFTLDMYGWKQSGRKFEQFLVRENINGSDRESITLLSDKWYPGAHIDYYIAAPLKMDLVVAGDLERIHKYYWINQTRKPKGTGKIFYITDSRNYTTPDIFSGCFGKIIPRDTLNITRGQIVVKQVYIFEMQNLQSDFTQVPLLCFP